MRAVMGLIATIVALATPSTSFACKCAPPASVADALREASAVFEGLVTGQTAMDMELEVALKVTQAWKGVDGETIKVRTRKDTAACGVPFEEGSSYLVYAMQSSGSDGVTLQVLRCGRTRPAVEASEDYAQLGVGVVPVSPRDPAAPPAPAAPAKPDHAADNAAPKPGQQLEPAAGGCASCTLSGSAAHGEAARAGWSLTFLGLALARVTRKRTR